MPTRAGSRSSTSRSITMRRSAGCHRRCVMAALVIAAHRACPGARERAARAAVRPDPARGGHRDPRPREPRTVQLRAGAGLPAGGIPRARSRLGGSRRADRARHRDAARRLARRPVRVSRPRGPRLAAAVYAAASAVLRRRDERGRGETSRPLRSAVLSRRSPRRSSRRCTSRRAPGSAAPDSSSGTTTCRS